MANITLINPENVTGLTSLFKTVNSYDSMFSLAILIPFYVILFLSLQKYGAKEAWMTTSLLSVIIGVMLTYIGLGWVWLWASVLLAVVSFFIFVAT